MPFGFYSDAGLSQPLDKLSFRQAADGSAADADAVAYFGDPVAGRKIERNSAPGVDPLYVALADATPAAQLTPLMAKLALSSGDLATALAGEPLALGTSVLSGAANAVTINVRINTPAMAIGRYADLRLTLPEVLESAV